MKLCKDISSLLLFLLFSCTSIAVYASSRGGKQILIDRMMMLSVQLETAAGMLERGELVTLGAADSSEVIATFLDEQVLDSIRLLESELKEFSSASWLRLQKKLEVLQNCSFNGYSELNNEKFAAMLQETSNELISLVMELENACGRLESGRSAKDMQNSSKVLEKGRKSADRVLPRVLRGIKALFRHTRSPEVK